MDRALDPEKRNFHYPQKNYVWQLIRSQLPTLLYEESEIQFSTVHDFTGEGLVFIKHTRSRQSHINITKVDDYLMIHLSNICYNSLLGKYKLSFGIPVYLNQHSSIWQITSDLALYINVCYNPLLGIYELSSGSQLAFLESTNHFWFGPVMSTTISY